VRVLLLAPPIFDYFYTPARREPLGLLYIREALHKALPETFVDIYDARINNRSKKVSLPPEFAYLSPIYKEDYSPFSLLHTYHRFGDSFVKILQYVQDGHYDVIGISSLFSAYHNDVENLIAAIKTVTTSIVAVGGWALKDDLAFWLENGNADYYLYGDGEELFPLLLGSISKVTVTTGKVTVTNIFSPGDRVDKPAWVQSDFLLRHFPRRTEEYHYMGQKSASVVASKGCVYRCSFCVIGRSYRFRQRSVLHIGRELRYLYEQGVRMVNFEDDNLLQEKEYARKFLRLLAIFHRKGMSFTAMNGITACNLAEHLEGALAAGFAEFNLSLATMGTGTLKKNNRSINSDCVEKIAHASVGRVPVLVYIIAGLPGSSLEELLADVRFLAGLPVLIGFSPLYLLPGVPSLARLGLPENRRLMRTSALWHFGGGLQREDVASVWKYIRMINHLKKNGRPEHDDPSLVYFSRSLREKVWYRMDRQGKWDSHLPVTVDLPDKILITRPNGEIMEMDFSMV